MRDSESIITTEYRNSLQETLNKEVPLLLEIIKNENVTHILICERTGILFKKAFQEIFKVNGINIKIGSLAPDYFIGEDRYPDARHVKQEQISKKLKFLPNSDDLTGKILIFDEITASGGTLKLMESGLINRGFHSEQIISKVFETFDVQKEGQPINEALSKRSNLIFKDDTYTKKFSRIRYLYFTRYKDTVRELTEMCLNACKTAKQPEIDD